MDSSSDDNEESFRILSRQGGVYVVCHDNNLVYKYGDRVRYSEEVAMRLVKQHTSVPVPIIIFDYTAEKNKIGMSFIRGSTLKSVWDELNEGEKERICCEIWTMIAQWRQIPLPHNLAHLHQCLADGSAATTDVLLEDLEDPPRSLDNDEALRVRIYQRYRAHHGERYVDTLLDMLPRSQISVFTHGDIAPRNIMINKRGRITGILDWELAGWYPSYWEYANLMKPSTDKDWQSWMDRTAPPTQKWDLSGIIAARRVLF